MTDTSATPPNASAQSGENSAFGNGKDIESAVWSFDVSTNELIPQWVNTDDSKPPSYCMIDGSFLSLVFWRRR